MSSASEGTASSGEEFDAAPAKEESGFFGMFRKMQSKIFQVEADIIRTVRTLFCVEFVWVMSQRQGEC